jgi:hypothetical protein
MLAPLSKSWSLIPVRKQEKERKQTDARNSGTKSTLCFQRTWCSIVCRSLLDVLKRQKTTSKESNQSKQNQQPANEKLAGNKSLKVYCRVKLAKCFLVLRGALEI